MPGFNPTVDGCPVDTGELCGVIDVDEVHACSPSGTG
jgi:hypothetical protein